MGRKKRVPAILFIIAVLISIITIVLAVAGMLFYSFESKKAKEKNLLSIKMDTEQISISLINPMWGFDVKQIEDIAVSIMQDRNIYGIIIEPQNQDLELYKKYNSNTAGWIFKRDSNWNVIRDNKRFDTDNFILEKKEIVMDGETIGKITLVGTNKFIEQDLKKYKRIIFGGIVLADIFIVFFLYIVLWNQIIRPIKIIDKFSGEVGKGQEGIIGEIFFLNEFDNLKESVKRMVTLLNERYEQILYSQNE